MENRRIYVVNGESGEYSDHEEWIVGVFENKRGAEELRDKKIKENKELKEKYEIAQRLTWGEITEEQAGMKKDEVYDYLFFKESYFCVTSFALNVEDVVRNEEEKGR